MLLRKFSRHRFQPSAAWDGVPHLNIRGLSPFASEDLPLRLSRQGAVRRGRKGQAHVHLPRGRPAGHRNERQGDRGFSLGRPSAHKARLHRVRNPSVVKEQSLSASLVRLEKELFPLYLGVKCYE